MRAKRSHGGATSCQSGHFGLRLLAAVLARFFLWARTIFSIGFYPLYSRIPDISLLERLHFANAVLSISIAILIDFGETPSE